MADPDPAGAKPADAHAGMPMSFSARVAGDERPGFDGGGRAFAEDFALRPGETLIRSTHGGRWIFEPNLAAGHLDFAAAVRERSGIVQTADGLIGEGRCVIPFVLPYPFASAPDDSSGHIDYRGGAWITLRASGDVAVGITDRNGRWQSLVGTASGTEERIDVTPFLEARNAFNVRLTLGANARVSMFRFEGSLTTARMFLPRLDAGINIMTLQGRDKYGLKTVPCVLLPDFRKDASVPLDRQADIRNGELQPGDETRQVIAPIGKGPVRATFAFDAPPGEKFAWVSVHVSVADGPDHAPQKNVKLEWRCPAGDFRPFAHAAIGNTPLPGDDSTDGERILDRAARTVHVRVTSDTPIRGLVFIGHLDMDAALSVRPQITHRWFEGSTEHQFTAPPGADRYFFRCGSNPTGHSIEMRLPSYLELPPSVSGKP